MTDVGVHLIHHGAAASSSSHTVVWIANDDNKSSHVIYSSHGILNVLSRSTVAVAVAASGVEDVSNNNNHHNNTSSPPTPIWSVVQTLRTSSTLNHTGTDPESTQLMSTKRVITALGVIRECHRTAATAAATTTTSVIGLASGFADGTVNYWSPMMTSRTHPKNTDTATVRWVEQILQLPPANGSWPASITDIDGMALLDRIVVVTCTAVGVTVFTIPTTTPTTTATYAEGSVVPHQEQPQQQQQQPATSTVIATFAANTVRLQQFANHSILLVGTAAPRHNKIHVYWMDHHITTTSSSSTTSTIPFKYVGHLGGHEDWLTDFAWSIHETPTLPPLLASASQDARIRLWEFKTTRLDDAMKATAATVLTTAQNDDDTNGNQNNIMDDENYVHEAEDDDNDNDDEEEIEDGEARLEIIHSQGVVTRVVLEALLYGHEEPVTSVAWHPKPQSVYRQDRVLLSSSMDRTILIWTCLDGGVWTPLSRVGAAGGILGGSIGSTLLGFLGLVIEPLTGESLIGHAYGGALHVWTLEKQQQQLQQEQEHGISEDESHVSPEELALRNRWKATPCVTGHFAGVTDCCWEASSGEYLLTLSNDQTCRLWGPVATSTDRDVWVELARPQVHGYDLKTLTSISTQSHRHIFVSGADEKEIRVFDAPMNAIKILKATKNIGKVVVEDGLERVERAYIPSLGLSNKASAADGADEDVEGIVEGDDAIHLPLERDLGAVSLWPEVGKLYGHNTELYCLTSTLTAKSGPPVDGPFTSENLVASSSKARYVDDASIRIWDVESGKCVQVLVGGHKSTVATLAFSPDGTYLASSGKDRRLCIWTRTTESDGGPFALATQVDSAHKRIVWSVHFCPYDPTMLATGGRDGQIKIWRLSISAATVACSIISAFEATSRSGKKAEPITAVSFAPVKCTGDEALLAIGLETGLIELWSIGEEGRCRLVTAIEPSSCHFSTITKLCWRPVRNDKEQELILASASMDHGVRLFSVYVK